MLLVKQSYCNMILLSKLACCENLLITYTEPLKFQIGTGSSNDGKYMTLFYYSVSCAVENIQTYRIYYNRKLSAHWFTWHTLVHLAHTRVMRGSCDRHIILAGGDQFQIFYILVVKSNYQMCFCTCATVILLSAASWLLACSQ